MKLPSHTELMINVLLAAEFLIGLARFPLVDHVPGGKAILSALLGLTAASVAFFWVRADGEARGVRVPNWAVGFLIFPLVQIPAFVVYLMQSRRFPQGAVSALLFLLLVTGAFMFFWGGANVSKKLFA